MANIAKDQSVSTLERSVIVRCTIIHERKRKMCRASAGIIKIKFLKFQKQKKEKKVKLNRNRIHCKGAFLRFGIMIELFLIWRAVEIRQKKKKENKNTDK